MVLLTGSTSAVMTVAGLAAPSILTTAAGIGAATGGTIGGLNAILASAATSGTIVAKSIGGGAAAGALFGSVAAGPAGGMAAVAAATIGSMASAGAAGITSSVIAGPVATVLFGPLGWVILGADSDGDGSIGQYTFDCWKQIVHDQSEVPSKGRLLKELIKDPSVKKVTVVAVSEEKSPEIVLENIWDEKFRVGFLCLGDGQIAAHAVKID